MCADKGKMSYYFAPMEGVTGYIYRNIHHKYYPGMDKYFAPFISPTPDCIMNPKEKADVLPEHNQDYELVPQILANRSEVFIPTARRLKEMGYEEVNFNLGCPSGTVTAKGKGAGFLNRPEDLDQCLAEIFDQVDMKISVKTRVGMNDPAEMERLLEIYNKYPLAELIVHPRIRADFYKGLPRMEVFDQVEKNSKNPVCYNGDIYEVADVMRIQETYPNLDRLMIGRGLLRNPAFLDEIKGCEQPFDWNKLKDFHDELYESYREVTYGDRPSLFRMKELWNHMSILFEDVEGMPKYLKKIRKANYYEDYVAVVDALWKQL